MKPIQRWLVAGAFAAALAGCSSTGPYAAAPDDRGVELAVQKRIAADTSLPASDVKVHADASSKRMELTGTVLSADVRDRVVEIAKDAQPGYAIKDSLKVQPEEPGLEQYTEDMARQVRDSAKAAGEKVGSGLEDAWLHTKVKAKLAAYDTPDAIRINVDVEDKAVTLRGQVSSAQTKADAARIASGVEGVQQVHDLLTVKP